MKRGFSNFLIIVITIFLVPIAGILISSALELYTGNASNSWPTANGVVISSRIDTTYQTSTETTTANNRDGRSTQTVHKKTIKTAVYTAVITYTYQLEGKEYQSSKYKLSSAQGDWVWVNELVSQFPAGKDVVVHYNPKKPSYAIIVPGLQGGEIFSIVFLSIFTIILLFLLLKTVKKRQKVTPFVADLTGASIEFTDFYNFNLKPKLQELEEKRKAAISIHNWKNYKRILLVLLVLVIIDVILFNKKLVPEYMIFVVPVSVLFAMFYPFVVLYHKGKNLLPIYEEYKKRIIPELVSFVNNNLRYEKEKGITETEFNRTRLFEKTTIFSSEDLITGEINDITYRMADVKAKQVYHSKSRSGNSSHRSFTSVFEGLYVIATFKKDFGPPVYLRYNDINQTVNTSVRSFLGSQLSDMVASPEPKGISIETANSEFNALFKVKCENEEQARAILTPAFINTTLKICGKYTSKLQQLLLSPVNIYINGNEVHIAIFELDVFDLNGFTSLVANNYTRRYYDLLNLSIELAETLK